jgi:hypothetical protein
MSIWDASLETANRWYDISWYGLLISGVIATLAAGATVMFLFLQFWSSGVREKYSDIRTSTLELETENAKRDAAAASERAAELELKAAQLDKDTTLLSAMIGEVNSRAARARRVAEQERFDRLQSQNGAAPRVITEEQHAKLVAFLDGKPIGSVIIVPRQDIDEPIRFAAQVEAVLRDARFEIMEPPPIGDPRRPYSWTFLGVAILVWTPDKPPPHAVSIREMFKELGIDVPMYLNVALPTPDRQGTVVIAVNTII